MVPHLTPLSLGEWEGEGTVCICAVSSRLLALALPLPMQWGPPYPRRGEGN